MRCCPSPRCNSKLKFVNPPAWSVVEPADSDGANGNGLGGHAPPPGPSVNENSLVGNASPTNGLLHAVKSAEKPCPGPYVPHWVGVSSAACAPPENASLKSVNGSSGVPWNVVVS